MPLSANGEVMAAADLVVAAEPDGLRSGVPESTW